MLCFLKFSITSNPFKNIFDEFFQNKSIKLTFSCDILKFDITTNMFIMYIVFNYAYLKQLFTFIKNDKNKLLEIKLSKLVNYLLEVTNQKTKTKN